MMLKFERVWAVTDFRHDDSDDEETSGLKDARDPGAGPKTLNRANADSNTRLSLERAISFL
jgi:hypothetical protein